MKPKNIAEVVCPDCDAKVVAYRTVGGRILVTSGGGVIAGIIGGIIGAGIGISSGGTAMAATVPLTAIGVIIGAGLGYIVSDKTLDSPKCPKCGTAIKLAFK